MSGASQHRQNSEPQDDKAPRKSQLEDHEAFATIDKDHGSEAEQASRLALGADEQAAAPAA
jgi:hypothetical protein